MDKRSGVLTKEDWRVLRLLSFYRLALIGLLLALHTTEYVPQVLKDADPGWFKWTCQAYALIALVLVGMVTRERPKLVLQAQLNFLADLLAIAVLTYLTGGVAGGIATLLLIPMVACASMIGRRMAMFHAAIATVAMFVEEFVRQVGLPGAETLAFENFDGSDFVSTGVLGLILFGTSVAASTVARRARRSEAMARRMGSEFDNLSRLNEVVLDTMDTGVIVLDGRLRIRDLNAAARKMLEATAQAQGRLLMDESPSLAERVSYWIDSGEEEPNPMSLGPGMIDVNVRMRRLGARPEAPIMVTLEDAVRVQEQAQQIKLAALGRMSASIAHEIRNPLAAISHAGQLLSEDPDLSQENLKLLAMIHRHSDRINRIITDVMALSRKREPSPESFALLGWLNEALTTYRETPATEQGDIELVDIPETVEVRFDRRSLQLLIFNLWDNAFRHGGAKNDKIAVQMTAGTDAKDNAWLDIADNGPGIAPEMIDQIFEPFFTTSHTGTGLGLYLAREMCESNQARLSYQKRPVGACFRISFSNRGRI